MACPNCGAQDPGPGLFCMSCGKRLPAPAAPTPAAPPAPIEMPSAMPVAPAWRSTTQTPATTNPDGNTTTFNIWGPFAGYGTRGRHVAWLINDHGDQADALRDVVRSRFERRDIPDATMEDVILTRRGILVDSRSYFLLRRKLATAGLYIDQFGQDLYVSQVTYFKGPYSNTRILIVGLVFLLAFLTPFLVSGAVGDLMNSAFGAASLFGGRSSSLSGGSVGVLCCLGPLYPIVAIAANLILLYSVYKWINDKDFLAVLRTSPNEFDTDDIVSLEKAVEQTVRESLDVVGIEQQLMPPADEYGFRRRLI